MRGDWIIPGRQREPKATPTNHAHRRCSLPTYLPQEATDRDVRNKYQANMMTFYYCTLHMMLIYYFLHIVVNLYYLFYQMNMKVESSGVLMYSSCSMSR